MSHCVEYQGQPMSLRELASVVGLHARTVQSRYSVGDRGERLIRPIGQGARKDLAQTSNVPQEIHVERRAVFPRGGKLLSHEESLRLAVIHSVEREQLIAHIVERLRAEERRRDGSSRRKQNGYSK